MEAGTRGPAVTKVTKLRKLLGGPRRVGGYVSWGRLKSLEGLVCKTPGRSGSLANQAAKFCLAHGWRGRACSTDHSGDMGILVPRDPDPLSL